MINSDDKVLRISKALNEFIQKVKAGLNLKEEEWNHINIETWSKPNDSVIGGTRIYVGGYPNFSLLTNGTKIISTSHRKAT